MKIKTVCERTGLTDRTIRYYIEEGIISPAFTENYLGRKSFDFTEEDVLQLQDIAVLRSFDFSIEEIRQILNDPSSSLSIIQCVKQRAQAELSTSQKKILALSSLNEHTVYTVGEIAKELSKPLVIIYPEKTVKPKLRHQIATIGKTACFFLIVWLPFLLSVGIVLLSYIRYDNPIVSVVFVFLTLLTLIPSCVYMFAPKIRSWQKKRYKLILLVLCLVCIPMSALAASQAVSQCNHIFKVYSVEIEGCVIQRCDICRDVRKVSHSAVKDDLVLPTCGTEGLTEGSHCSHCGKVMVQQEIIPMTNEHIYAPYTIEPTCGQDGYVLMLCQCGQGYLRNTLAANETHSFVNNADNGLRCSHCGLEVCENNYVSQDDTSGGAEVEYYITGTTNEVQERTLVIYGTGDMPAFADGMVPLYKESQYIQEVTTVIICDGITSLSEGAFEWVGKYYQNPYRSISCFLVKSESLILDTDSKLMSGILCEVTYQNREE